MARNINKADPAGIGHNSLDETGFHHHLAKIIAARGPLEAAAAVMKAARKAARGDGVSLKQLDHVIKLSTWEPEEVRDYYATEMRYAAWMRLPIGTQLDLFDSVPEAARPAIDWHAKGFAAATTGRGVPGVAPDDCPADQMQAWLQGWHEGQRANAPRQSPARLELVTAD